MQIQLIAIGNRMPNWVTTAFTDYQRRLPKDYQLTLTEISAKKRKATADITKISQIESELLLNAVNKNNLTIALDRQGQSISTTNLATKLKTWHDDAQNISILIGGPEGITTEALAQSHQTWSLSKLTLPHPLVRIILAEQIYRAFSILSQHPYHR